MCVCVCISFRELIEEITIVPDIVSGRVSSLRETAAVKAKAKVCPVVRHEHTWGIIYT